MWDSTIATKFVMCSAHLLCTLTHGFMRSTRSLLSMWTNVIMLVLHTVLNLRTQIEVGNKTTDYHTTILYKYVLAHLSG